VSRARTRLIVTPRACQSPRTVVRGVRRVRRATRERRTRTRRTSSKNDAVFFFRHSCLPISRMAGREGKGRMEGRRMEVPASCQVKWSTARVCRHGCVLAAAPTTRARLDIKSNTYCGLCWCDRPKPVRQPGRKIWRLTNQRGSDRPRSQSERERSGLCAVRMHRWTGAVVCAGVSYNRILTVVAR